MKKVLLTLMMLAIATPALADGGYKKPRNHGKHWNNHSNNHWNNNGNNNHWNNHNNYYNNNGDVYNYKYNNGNNNDAWIAGVGGFLGGLVVGGAIAEPGPGYYANPTPQEYCGTQWESRWNAVYQQWEKIPHTVCWVQ